MGDLDRAQPVGGQSRSNNCVHRLVSSYSPVWKPFRSRCTTDRPFWNSECNGFLVVCLLRQVLRVAIRP